MCLFRRGAFAKAVKGHGSVSCYLTAGLYVVVEGDGKKAGRSEHMLQVADTSAVPQVG